MTARAHRDFEVLPVVVPDGEAPLLDGLPGDAAYKNAAFVRIGLGDGEFARAWLVHAGGALHVCVTDLEYQMLAKAPPRSIGLAVDRDASGDRFASPGDVAFLVDQNGVPAQAIGDGERLVVTLEPQHGFTAVIERGPGGWSAEMRIADALLGGWNHAAGILFTHGGLEPPGGAGLWPPASNPSRPETWAPASFGPLAPLSNRPPVAVAGGDRTLHVGLERSVSLDGSASFDADGDPLALAWSQIAGPAVSLADATTSAPSFTARPGGDPVVLRFRLSASDGAASASDEVEVKIVPARRPGKNAGAAFVRGDADGSGELEITDAVAVLGTLFLGSARPGCEDAADADDSGVLDISDAVRILGHLFLGGSPPPAPGPRDCGLDPSSDALACENPRACD